MKKLKLLSCVFCALLIISCDILRALPYEVKAWTPGEGFFEDPENVHISLLFSLASDKAKTEQAFSMTEDGKTLKGYFSWQGLRLVFTPAAPLEKGRNYSIILGTGAQDTKGLSLEHRFEASFSTYPQGGRLALIKTEPDYEGSLSENRGEFRLYFSEPVNLHSCIDHISFSPATHGSWRLEDNDKTAVFVPREPWQQSTTYRMRVADAFTSLSGSALASEYVSVFHTAEDREKPVLLKIFAIHSGDNVAGFSTEEIPEEIIDEIVFEVQGQFSAIEYSGWERLTKLGFVFSKPVDLSALRNLITVEPALNLVLESSSGFENHAVFRFAEYPKWGSPFLFHLSSGVKDSAGNESAEAYAFRIRVEGAVSKPPALVGIRLPLAPGNSENPQPAHFSTDNLFLDLPIEIGVDRYPYGVQTPAWIELYFESAPDTEIDIFSVMDFFRVESTNQALAFSPRSVRATDFTIDDPQEAWKNFQRFEVRGFFTNTVNSGIVTFRILPGLTDKRGNRSETDFRISLLK